MGGGEGALFCGLPVLRQLGNWEDGFRLSPGEFEGTGSSFYQVGGKTGLGPLASLPSTEPPPWVVTDNLLIVSVISPQQALSVTCTKCSSSLSAPIVLTFILLCVPGLTGVPLCGITVFLSYQFLEVQIATRQPGPKS